MNIMQKIIYPTDALLTLAESFDLDMDFADRFDAHAKQRLGSYDHEKSSGLKISEHLDRVYLNASSFFASATHTRGAYSTSVVNNIARAYRNHDIAKTLDDVNEWRTGPDKPDLSHLTTEEKLHRTIRRQKHTSGQNLIDEIAQVITQETGKELTHSNLSYLNLMKAVMADHHEDLLAGGPQRKVAEQQGMILRSLIIIDTLDGKRKNGKSLEQNLHEMSQDPKFDSTIVHEFAQHLGVHCLTHNRAVSGLANPALS